MHPPIHAILHFQGSGTKIHKILDMENNGPSRSIHFMTPYNFPHSLLSADTRPFSCQYLPIFPCPIGLRMFSLASVKPSLQYRYQTPFSHQIMKWINIMKLFPTSVSQLLFHLWRRACIFKTLIIFSPAFGLIENVTDPWKLCLLSKPWFH